MTGGAVTGFRTGLSTFALSSFAFSFRLSSFASSSATASALPSFGALVTST